MQHSQNDVLQLLFGIVAHMFVDESAVVEYQKCRCSGDCIFAGSIGTVVDAQLAEDDFPLKIKSHLVYLGIDELAGPAADLPAVQDKRRIALDGPVQAAVVHHDGDLGKNLCRTGGVGLHRSFLARLAFARHHGQ
jgi:hypothetical protein